MTHKNENSKQVLALCDQALQLQDTQRQAFLGRACKGDERLRASVDSVLMAINQAGRFLEADAQTPAICVELTGRRIGNYQICQRLGEGGMGSVYLAERQEDGFEQQVAIKFVHAHLLAKELVQRFNAERQILAGLNHPYIAALIDGGTTEDGMPYIVMEYVQGKPIDEYCDEHRLDVRERLRMIQKISLAVQAAHQNLVVHRDLKPSNVLVTADGIPKLLDFGIAKLIEPNAAHGNTTVFGRQALTPDYASPEQILENRVTTASDVYSLGILSYQLLAGQRPYNIVSDSHRALVRSVEGLTIPPASAQLGTGEASALVLTIAQQRSSTPKRLRRQLAGDLDNILLKALHQAPDRRYGSVAAFSADLERYLKGLPVEARPDTFGYRFSRFVARHRFGVLAGAGLSLAVVAGLGGTTWAYLQAEQARADADRRFAQVRELANTMMFDVFEEIEKVPGSKSALQTMAATAQDYLQGLSEETDAPDEVKLDAARGFSRLSSILSAPAVADPEHRVQASDAADKAAALFEQLTQDGAAPMAVYHALGQFRSDRGAETLYSDNDPAQTREDLQLALAAFDQALALAPGNAPVAANRLTAQIRLADSYKWQQDYAQAAQMLASTLEQAQQLRTRFPDDELLLRAVADAHQMSGEVNWFVDDFETAILDYQASLNALDTIASRYEQHRNPVLEPIVTSNWSLANSLIDLDRPAEAETHYRRAIKLTELRVARDPDDRDAARTQAIMRGSLAAALVNLEKVDEAIAMIGETTAWFETQAAKDPDTSSAQRSVAVAYHVTGNIHQDAGLHEAACGWYRKTLGKWQQIDGTIGLSEFDADQPERLQALLDEQCS